MAFLWPCVRQQAAHHHGVAQATWLAHQQLYTPQLGADRPSISFCLPIFKIFAVPKLVFGIFLDGGPDMARTACTAVYPDVGLGSITRFK
jgi:hypothetical protein